MSSCRRVRAARLHAASGLAVFILAAVVPWGRVFAGTEFSAPNSAFGPQLIDRVLARVGATAITLTDMRAAIGLGLVELPEDGDRQSAALQGAIDRALQLAEVARFPPPDPAREDVARELAAMKAHAGEGLPELLAATGLDEGALERMARDTLRIRSYVAQRFGTAARVGEEEVRRYYEDHPEQFMREGVRLPFEEAEPAVRQRVSAERLQATIRQWIADLRTRTEVTIAGDGR